MLDIFVCRDGDDGGRFGIGATEIDAIGIGFDFAFPWADVFFDVAFRVGEYEFRSAARATNANRALFRNFVELGHGEIAAAVGVDVNRFFNSDVIGFRQHDGVGTGHEFAVVWANRIDVIACDLESRFGGWASDFDGHGIATFFADIFEVFIEFFIDIGIFFFDRIGAIGEYFVVIESIGAIVREVVEASKRVLGVGIGSAHCHSLFSDGESFFEILIIDGLGHFSRQFVKALHIGFGQRIAVDFGALSPSSSRQKQKGKRRYYPNAFIHVDVSQSKDVSITEHLYRQNKCLGRNSRKKSDHT